MCGEVIYDMLGMASVLCKARTHSTQLPTTHMMAQVFSEGTVLETHSHSLLFAIEVTSGGRDHTPSSLAKGTALTC